MPFEGTTAIVTGGASGIGLTPVRRAGEPVDIANAAMFLCRDDSSYVTGQVIGVHGGRNT